MAKQYLTFVVNDVLYAVEVFQVQEVLGYTKPVKLPCAQHYIEGLINSRDHGISIINLRAKFNMELKEPDKYTRIVVLEIHIDDGIVTVGAVADAVEEVIEIDEKTIENAPKFGNAISSEFIKGITKKEDRFIIILDVDKIFSFEEEKLLDSMSNEIDDSLQEEE